MEQLPTELLENILDLTCYEQNYWLNFALVCSYFLSVAENIKNKIKKRFRLKIVIKVDYDLRNPDNDTIFWRLLITRIEPIPTKATEEIYNFLPKYDKSLFDINIKSYIPQRLVDTSTNLVKCYKICRMYIYYTQQKYCIYETTELKHHFNTSKYILYKHRNISVDYSLYFLNLQDILEYIYEERKYPCLYITTDDKIISWKHIINTESSYFDWNKISNSPNLRIENVLEHPEFPWKITKMYRIFRENKKDFLKFLLYKLNLRNKII